MSDLHLKLEKIEGNELIVRQGKAVEIEEKQQFLVSEITPESLVEYVAKRNELGLVDKNDSIFIVNLEEAKIFFREGIHSNKGSSFSAGLFVNPDIEKVFGIIPTMGFSKEFVNREILDILRRNRRFFADYDNSVVLKEMMNFTASRTTGHVQKDDRRGNIDYNLKSDVVTSVNGLSFILAMPVMKGGEKIHFRVEIISNVNESQARFMFESLELPDILKTETENRLNKAIEGIRAIVPEIPIIVT